MKIKLFLDKSVEQNAEIYFEKAKKSKKKVKGAIEIVEKTKKKLKRLQKKELELKQQQEKEQKPKRKKEWYEKFRWFHSSEGFLCIGGRDATTNEIVVKKHTDPTDLVFHTDIAGSPFFIIKTQGKKPGKATIEETAQATASYSRAWKLGVASLDVFYVKPDQVTKETKAGEYMPKGSFMVYGKRNNLTVDIGIAIGIKDNIIIGGPVNAVKANAEKHIIINQGNKKASDIAKKIRAKIGGELDDIIRMLPAGGCSIK